MDRVGLILISVLQLDSFLKEIMKSDAFCLISRRRRFKSQEISLSKLESFL